eukprot:5151572-Prorocentrum_lima.AAC.1
MEEGIAMDVEYHKMLSQVGRAEHTSLQEAHWRLYEQYTDAKRRWRYFTGRHARRHRFQCRRWSTVQQAAPPR